MRTLFSNNSFVDQLNCPTHFLVSIAVSEGKRPISLTIEKVSKEFSLKKKKDLLGHLDGSGG